MKITAVETYIVDCFRANWLFVQLQTDAGLLGVGEGTLEGREPTVAQAIAELSRYLVGEDPFAIQRHHMHMQRDSYWRQGPILSTALSAVEMALWDIKGKALGVPVYELLGGALVDRVKVYANGWFAGAKEPDEFAAKAVVAVEQGFRALKWDPFGQAYLTLSTADLNKCMANVAAVREAVGPDIDLLIEAHGRFNVQTAIQVGRALAPFAPAWYEEPVLPGSAHALAQVRAASPVPVAAGERCYSRFDCAELLQLQAVDILQPDVCHIGGLIELQRVAALADAALLPLSPHNPNGPVANAATLQFAATCHNFTLLETMVTDVPWRQDITTEAIQFEDGYMMIPNRPGLGLELNLEAMARYPYRPHDLRHYTGALTAIRPPDARRWF
jgi:galactonate dehydratase